MASQMGFVFNADICIGCKACVISCKNENQTSETVSWRRVSSLKKDLFLSNSCNHCSSPECFRVCPVNAFTKRQDGIVLIDSSRCTGCMVCVSACPYSAPQYDFESRKVSKCQMCFSRQDQGLLPACVESCSTKALNIVDLEEFYDEDACPTIDGFPDIRMTQPSIVFYPSKPKKRYFIAQ